MAAGRTAMAGKAANYDRNSNASSFTNAPAKRRLTLAHYGAAAFAVVSVAPISQAAAGTGPFQFGTSQAAEPGALSSSVGSMVCALEWWRLTVAFFSLRADVFVRACVRACVCVCV